jgi:membrane glycosyltransferase
MAARRLLVLLIAVTTVLILCHTLLQVLQPGGWTVAKALMLGGTVGAAPWVGLCLANGLIGFILRLTAPDIPRAPTAGPIPRTALALTVRNEDLDSVLPQMRRLLDELDAAGVGGDIALWILSDTTQPAMAQQETAAVAAFRARDRDPERIGYRRRTSNDGFKAGNIMEFLDQHADGFELMLVLDADSQMSGRAVLRLVHAMQENASLGIVQHLAVGVPAASPFPRLFQFGMRAGMRSWATALAWWQGDEGCYWGHNAILRVAPFRAHCRLTPLPNGRPILSHDQVEAALLCGAGWGVRLLPDEDGSAEANPPALPEFQRRELRWLAGNFEYRHLLARPGLRPMGRWQLLQAILLFASTPFYLIFLLGAALAAATDSQSAFPAGPALALTCFWAGALYAPKILGYLELLLAPGERARYGGSGRLLAGIAAETVFTLQLDAVSVVSKAIATLKLLLGARPTWNAQNRSARGVAWSEATALFWPHTLLGSAVFAAFATAGWGAALWAAPLAGGLLTSIPFCVLTADPRVGHWLRRIGLAAIPEEIAPPAPGGTRLLHADRAALVEAAADD